MTHPFVYLHGFASSPQSKKAQFFRSRLEALGHSLEAPDLSQGDFENLTLSGQLAVMDRVIAGRPAILIGSSLGGYLAALYAARHPEVERLLLLAPAFGFARRWAAALGPQLEQWRTTGWLSVYHYGEQRMRRVSYCLIEDAGRYEDYPSVSQPVLVIHGLRDSVVRPEWSEEFTQQNPHARIVWVDSDHELVDALEEIWQHARDFLLGGERTNRAG